MQPNNNARWARLMWKMLNIDETELNHKLPCDCITSCASAFHKQVLECWILFKNQSPQNVEEIHNEYVFYNKFVCSNNKPLKLANFRGAQDSLNELTLKGIINDNGLFLSIHELRERLNWNISIYDYNIIKSSIPIIWKQHILNKTPSMHVYGNITVRIRGQLINLAQVQNKDIYWELMANKDLQVTAINTWIDLFPFLNDFNWHTIFYAVHKSSIETYLQSFQYKIVHRIINCKYNLYKWNIKENPFCLFCKHFNTIEHHFFLCALSKLFWENVESWLTDLLKLNNRITFAICEILFGYSLSKKPCATTIIINWVISLGKWFINYCRSKEKDIVFIEFQRLASSKLGVYKYITCPAVEGVKTELYTKLNCL